MQRPQTIDLDPWPLGGLVIPATEVGDAYRDAALRGEPDAARLGPDFVRLAAADDAAGALRALEAAGDDDVLAYDRFVLAPDAEGLERLRARLSGELAELLELAAYRAGLRPDLPSFAHLDGELLAAARASEASLALEQGDLDGAAALLEEGIAAAREASPGLAAQLCMSLVEVETARGAGPARAVELLREARALVASGRFPTLSGELALELGVLLQETAPARLSEAAGLLQEAARALDPERHPRAHGFAQMRLGLAYLSMPMRDAGDALRMGVAVRALEQSVASLAPERDPDLWTSAAVNLANALQLLPSEHLTRNLRRAVELYARALELRPADVDPAGRARLLFNSAQAAASLDDFDHAIRSLSEACPLLQRTGLGEELGRARAMLEDLKRAVAVGGVATAEAPGA